MIEGMTIQDEMDRGTGRAGLAFSLAQGELPLDCGAASCLRY